MKMCVCEKEKDTQLDSSFQSNEYCHSVIDPLYGPPFSGFDLLLLYSTQQLYFYSAWRNLLCVTLVKQQD